MPFKDPEKMKIYMRERRTKQKTTQEVKAKSVNHTRKPVNPQTFILSYSRKKYQYTFYMITSEGQKTLVRSFYKGSILSFPGLEIDLTWGPDEVQ